LSIINGAAAPEKNTLNEHLLSRCTLLSSWLLVGLLLFSTGALAWDEWGADLEIYGWLPIISLELEDGTKDEITRDDILDDFDIAALWAARIRKGRWSLTSDFIYLDISKKSDVSLLSIVPSLATLDEAGFNAWIITPNLGYTVLDNERQKIDLYAGARYFRIEFDVTIDIDPILPGDPSRSRKESPSVSQWDGIVGARGFYNLPGKWFFPYSVNAGTGESDFTWGAQAGLGYRFRDLSALFGWRYLTYDVGSDTIIKELILNGPFAGVVFHW
jgi:hypothetical protein